MPPARPSAAELKHYRLAVRAEGPHANWALLGSTPEIRSLAAEEGKSLSCVEVNREVFDALAQLVRPPCTARLVCTDWLELQGHGEWDVVFGDGALNMLPPSQHGPFLQNVHAMLGRDGLALLRVHTASCPRFGDAAELFAWHRAHPGPGSWFSRTRTDLDLLWLEPTTLKVSFAEYQPKLRELLEVGAIGRDEFEAYESLLAFNRIDLYYVARQRFEELVRPYFRIEAIRTGRDYVGAANHPIYALRKKSD